MLRERETPVMSSTASLKICSCCIWFLYFSLVILVSKSQIATWCLEVRLATWRSRCTTSGTDSVCPAGSEDAAAWLQCSLRCSACQLPGHLMCGMLDLLDDRLRFAEQSPGQVLGIPLKLQHVRLYSQPSSSGWSKQRPCMLILPSSSSISTTLHTLSFVFPYYKTDLLNLVSLWCLRSSILGDTGLLALLTCSLSCARLNTQNPIATGSTLSCCTHATKMNFNFLGPTDV